MQDTHSTLKIGTIIRRRYEVENVLGKRSVGTVYLVRDRRGDHKLFVLKEVLKPVWKERFQFIIDSMAFTDLDHPALPHVHKVFNVNKFNQTFMLMEYIEGPDLETLRLTQPGQRFSPLQVVSSIVPVVEALTYLHRQDRPIIHGDIKPSNIIIHKENGKEGGVATLVGFSLVKKVDTNKTLTFDRYQAPGYKAPEQYGGMADCRVDVYALGAVLYTLLTGRVPAGVLYRVRQQVEKKPDPLSSINQIAPDIPMGIANVIHRAMSMDKNSRYATIEQFWNALWQISTIAPTVQLAGKQVEQTEAEKM